ncbi:MAG: dynamin family protein [Bacteroidia bacterium]|nr:dynamin family protein [Bacteroidia bacterium]
MLTDQLKALRLEVEGVVLSLNRLAVKTGSTTITSTLRDILDRIHDPYMFVIVGEVKAGKSSFINALLGTGQEICKVAPSPMTDTIQQIVYGEREEIISINPYLKRIKQPIDILKEIAIVDTPGTNTIIEHHQEITENFIPVSDLIVFVFEAKNPYRQSAWEFFDFISEEWHKKVIFVLQQKDLMNDEDLKVNERGVLEHATKKGISKPNVFCVSAKMEIEANPDSGYDTLRLFIEQNITGGQAPVLKLISNLETGQKIHQQIGDGIMLRRQQYEADLKFRKEITGSLDKQASKSNDQVDMLVENLVAAYERNSSEFEEELENGLAFTTVIKKSFSAIFDKSQSTKRWLEHAAKTFESKLNKALGQKLDKGVIDIADDVQQMAKIIQLKIQSSQTILKNDQDLFSDIADQRVNVLKDLQASFSNFLENEENFIDKKVFEQGSGAAPKIATGSGLAAIGVMLTALTQGAVFDITGGIITTIGLIFAGVSVGLQRKKILKAFNKAVGEGKQQLESEVKSILKDYINRLKGKIDRNFYRFDEMLDSEKDQIEVLNKSLGEIESKISALLKTTRSSAESIKA